MTHQDQYRLLPVWWYYLSVYSAGMIIKAGKELIQGVRKCSIIAYQCSTALVVRYGFYTSPHAAEVVVFKIYTLKVSVLGFLNALPQFSSGITVGQLVPCPVGGIPRPE